MALSLTHCAVAAKQAPRSTRTRVAANETLNFRGLTRLATDIASGKSTHAQLLFIRAWVDDDGSYASWEGHAFVVPDAAWLAQYCEQHGAARAGERIAFVQVGADGTTVDLGERCLDVTVAAGAVLVVERDLQAATVPPVVRASLVRTRGAAFVRGIVTAPSRAALPALRMIDLDGESEAHEIRGGMAYTFEARPQSYDDGTRADGTFGAVELGAQRSTSTSARASSPSRP